MRVEQRIELRGTVQGVGTALGSIGWRSLTA